MIKTNIKILELYIQDVIPVRQRDEVEEQIQILIDNQLDDDSSNIENLKSIPSSI